MKDHWVSSGLWEEVVPSWPVFCAALSNHGTTVNWRTRRCLWASLALVPSHPPFIPTGRRQVLSPITYQGLLYALPVHKLFPVEGLGPKWRLGGSSPLCSVCFEGFSHALSISVSKVCYGFCLRQGSGEHHPLIYYRDG